MVTIGVPGITIKDLLEKGIICDGTKVFSNSSNIEGTIQSNGDIQIEIKGVTRIFPFPSGAARAVEGKSLNGWIYWKIYDSDTQSYKELDFYRKKYLQKHSD
ncbi:MAG: hypothetical protein H6550_00930 [Chitinophagales bacterium]|nr:hypothetical protein [Chitinophagales bacterium]